jgi:hypothetical protein
MTEEFDYFGNPHVSTLVDLCLQLAADVHVTAQRQRALEMVLVRSGHLGATELEEFAPDDAQRAELDATREARVMRLLRIMTEAGPAEHPLRQQWEEALAARARSAQR